ncbi:MAG TPA: hypothetical protein VJ697_09485 [Nitrososphaeraceae archaeon]|nr:hypothetical protein [Nitrososphaeraceae archaeon]
MTCCEVSKEVNSINSTIKMLFVRGYDNIINNKFKLEVKKKPVILTQILKLVKKYMI